MCGDGVYLNIKLVNPCDDGNGFETAFVTPFPTIQYLDVNLDNPTPLIYSPGFFADTYSLTRNIPTFCGDRVFDFFEGPIKIMSVTDLITV